MDLIAAALTVCSLNVSAPDIKPSHSFSPTRQDNINTVSYTPPTKGQSRFGDLYENNNSIEEATKLVPDNYYDLDSYVSS